MTKFGLSTTGGHVMSQVTSHPLTGSVAVECVPYGTLEYST